MSLLLRFKTAFAIVVAVVGILVVFDILLTFHIGDFLFSYWFGVPAFFLAYLNAPWVSKYIPYK